MPDIGFDCAACLALPATTLPPSPLPQRLLACWPATLPLPTLRLPALSTNYSFACALSSTCTCHYTTPVFLQFSLLYAADAYNATSSTLPLAVCGSRGRTARTVAAVAFNARRLPQCCARRTIFRSSNSCAAVAVELLRWFTDFGPASLRILFRTLYALPAYNRLVPVLLPRATNA